MKIVDTFLFSEPHEKDLLWVKFNLEDKMVDKWIILESPYTFQGQYKGLHAKKILKDEKFNKFIDKVVVISPNEDFQPLHGGSNVEGKNFERENHQRSLCLSYILHNLQDSDTVIISDTDEAIDFSDQNRSDAVMQILQQYDVPLKIQRMRYWFDFDNRCFLPTIHIPFVPVKYLRENPQWINARHFDHLPKFNFNETPVAFEYSYCFRSFEDVWRKKCTYSHTGFTEESVRTALECNHWPRSELRGEKVGQEPYDFFEKVELNEVNSPKFVRDNLEYLRTNIVDANYKENRGKYVR